MGKLGDFFIKNQLIISNANWSLSSKNLKGWTLLWFLIQISSSVHWNHGKNYLVVMDTNVVNARAWLLIKGKIVWTYPLHWFYHKGYVYKMCFIFLTLILSIRFTCMRSQSFISLLVSMHLRKPFCMMNNKERSWNGHHTLKTWNNEKTYNLTKFRTCICIWSLILPFSKMT